MAVLQLTMPSKYACVQPRGQRPAPFTAARPKAPKQQQKCASTRRESIAGIALAPFVPGLVSVPQARADEAAAASARQYFDQADAFSLTVPAGWEFSEGQIEGNKSYQGSSGARRTLAWYPSNSPADQINVTLTITNTSVEFTGLGRYDHGHARPRDDTATPS